MPDVRLAAEPAPDLDRSVSVATAAATLEVDESLIRKMLRAGDLHGHTVGQGKTRPAVRVYVRSIRAYQERHAIKPAGRPRPAVPPKRAVTGARQREAEAHLQRLGVLPQHRD